MFCRCPQCDAQQEVSAQQLRDSRGLLSCQVCAVSFDALATLSERPDDQWEPRLALDDAFAGHAPAASAGFWRAGSLLMALLLLVQWVYFDAAGLSRVPGLRPLIGAVCQVLPCRENTAGGLENWSLSHSALQPHLGQRYLLTAALTNQADTAQACPSLQLTLMDFKGQALTQRVFTPRQYSKTPELAANQTLEIRLPLVIPAEFGGFSLTLI